MERITIVIKKDVLLFAAIALAVLAVVALNVYAFSRLPGGNGVEKTAENFKVFKAAENPADKCATPEGYTDEQWKQHMGHHPDQYKECL